MQIVLFFTSIENWCQNAIENILLPCILKHSVLFNGGRDLDLTKMSIRDVYLPQLARCMKEVSYIKINSKIGSDDLLRYLVNFKNLCYMHIILNENDNFYYNGIVLPIKLLRIQSKFPVFYRSDCISQIMNCCPNLEEVSLSGGSITIHTIAKLADPSIEALSLTNIRVITKLKEMLASLFFRRGLRKLKLKLTNHMLYDANFLGAAHELFNRLTGNTELEDLSFTLDQCCDQQLRNIALFYNLKKIKVYYTVQFEISKLFELIRILENLNHPIEVTFKEYYDPPSLEPENMERHYVDLEDKSHGCKTLIQSANENIRVLQYDYKPKVEEAKKLYQHIRK